MASAHKRFTLHGVRLRHKEGISVEGDSNCDGGVHPDRLSPPQLPEQLRP